MISSDFTDKLVTAHDQLVKDIEKNEGSKSQSWEGREVGCLSGLWDKICNIIQQIFDKCLAVLCCCRFSPEDSLVSNEDSSPKSEQKTLEQKSIKKVRTRKYKKSDQTQNKNQNNTSIQKQIKDQFKVKNNDSEETKNGKHTSDDDSTLEESYADLELNSILKKQPKGLTNVVMPAPKAGVIQNLGSDFIIKNGCKYSKKTNPNCNKLKDETLSQTSNIGEKILNGANDHLDNLNSTIIDEIPTSALVEVNLNSSLEANYPTELKDYYVSEDEIETPKVQNNNNSTNKSTSIVSNMDFESEIEPGIISKKNVSANFSDTEATKSLKKSLMNACTLIEKGASPEQCSSSFYASLMKETDKLSSGDKLELSYILITMHSEINAEITKAVERSTWLDPRVKISEEKPIYYSRKNIEFRENKILATDEQAQALEKGSKDRRELFNKKRIENLKANFFGKEFSVFIADQISAKELKSVQKITQCVQDSGVHEYEKQTEIISMIMTTLYFQLARSTNENNGVDYSFESRVSYLTFMEDQKTNIGALIQAEPPQNDVLRVLYSDDDSETGESFEEEVNVDTQNVHNNAMDFLKAKAALQRLREFYFNDQQQFKMVLQDIFILVKTVDPSNELYQALQKACRECIGTYILKAPVSALDEVKEEYSQLAKILGLQCFEDLAGFVKSDAFKNQKTALQQLKDFNAETHDVKLIAKLLKIIASSLGDIDESNPLFIQFSVAFRKIPGLYIENFKPLQTEEFKEIKDFYDSAAQKFGHKTHKELEEMVNKQPEDSQKMYDLLDLLHRMNSEKLKLNVLTELLEKAAKVIDKIDVSHFLHKAIEREFGLILDKFIDILMDCKATDNHPSVMNKMKAAYDALAIKLNYPCSPELQLLLSSDFSDKYTALQLLEGYSVDKMGVNSFAKMLTNASNLIKKIDSTHPLHTRLNATFSGLIAKFTDYSTENLTFELKKIEQPFNRLCEILGSKDTLDINTDEAAEADPVIADISHLETFRNLRENLQDKMILLKAESEITDIQAMGLVWKTFLDELLFLKLNRETAIGMLLVTFQRELKLKGLPKIFDKEKSFEEYLKLLSQTGKLYIEMIRNETFMYYNSFMKAGLSDIEAEDFLNEIVS